jgi:hypothetical protein
MVSTELLMNRLAEMPRIELESVLLNVVYRIYGVPSDDDEAPTFLHEDKEFTPETIAQVVEELEEACLNPDSLNALERPGDEP